jgi:hypothetical protein
MDLGRAVLFAGSALLLISLFTEWYDVGLTGWEVFEALDLVLAALAIGGMVASVRPDLLPSWSGLGVPGAALLIVVVQLLNDPPAAVGASPSSGAWIALAGTFLMAAGAALSLSAISVTVQVRERDVRRRVPAVDRRHEDLAAEDLDADADARMGDGVDEAPRGSLFATGLGGTPTDADADAGAGGGDAEPPRRSGRFAPRSTDAEAPTTAAPAGGPASSAAAPAVGGAPAPGRPEAADLERTQPLSALPDDADEPERP